ncbi:MAG: HD domain-containing protein [Schwartzia sp.]|nr:HD domain-containing protein [Schwartzia sp. (in: firmicutes)]
MEEKQFVRRVCEAGGRVAIVGGWVRDSIRGANPKDKDYVVAGLDEESFGVLFPDAQKVGRSFPVFLMKLNGESSEIALARTEQKTGTGYLGFEPFADKSVTLEADLSRRDTTMNAMALELFSNGKPPQRIDLFGGEEDIRLGRIRAVSERFLEDPVRALRAARQAAVFGFSVEPHTIDLMAACREELMKEPQPRIFGELALALAASRPSVFFRTLLTARLLDAVFPEIFALIGKTQPEAFHPEGDAFEHTMATVDAVAGRTENLIVRFAALVHDVGKGTTPEAILPHHYGHEVRGLSVLDEWNRRMQLPRPWLQVAKFVIAEHMRASRLKKPGKIAELLVALSRLPVPAEEVLHIFTVDHGELSPYFERYDSLIKELLAVRGNDAPKELSGEAVGEWIRKQRAHRIQVAAKQWKNEMNE